MSIIAVIPARGGSRRIPGKNIRPFHGRPIIEYSIGAAKAAGLFSRIYVSTDSPAIASAAYRAGVEVSHRPHRLAVDAVGTQEVTRDVVHRQMGAGMIGDPVNYVCCIYATAPLMHYMDLIEGYALLRHSGAPYAYSVGPDGQDAGQWYWGTVEAYLASVSLDYGRKYPLSANRTCDINTEDDWARAERLYDAVINGEAKC